MGSPLSLIGPVAQLAGGGGGKGGGGGGGSQPQGVSPQEAALAQYKYGQQLVKDESQFANTNTGISTGLTQMTGGARFGKALQLANTAQTNANAIGAAQQSLAQTQGTAAGQQAAAQDQGFSGNQGSLGQPSGASGTPDQTV